MTGVEFNSAVVAELGWTMTTWRGNPKPGSVSQYGIDLFGGKQIPLRAIRKATLEDWERFVTVCTKIGRKPTRFSENAWCVEACD